MTREVAYVPGARFFEQDGVTMFEFRLDGGSVIGPRKATAQDKTDHEIEWRAFNVGRLPQLDHDGDGVPGGAVPVEKADLGDASLTSRRVSDEHKHVPAHNEPAPAKRRGRPRKVVKG